MENEKKTDGAVQDGKPLSPAAVMRNRILPPEQITVVPTEITEEPAYTPASYADTVLGCALDIGVGIQENGGEVARVEDTVTRICRAFGGESVRVFAIPNMIQASLVMKDGTTAFSMRRITSISNHLYRLQCFNALSRELCAGRLSLADAPAAIAQAEEKRPFPDWLLLLGGALSAGAFAVFFGGNLLDGLAAFCVGVVMSLLDLIPHPHIHRMAHTMIESFVGGSLALLICALFPTLQSDLVLIGTIMVPIPGLAFGNSLRDMISGNLISGSLRLLEVLLLAGMIALGYGAAMMLFGGLGA